MYTKKQLITITGMDGSGKSSLIESLLAEVDNSLECSIWDVFNTQEVKLFASKKDIDRYLSFLETKERTLFLTHALLASINNALKSDAEIIFINAYYYKYFAIELAHHCPIDFIQQLTSLFPICHHTFVLQTPLKTTAIRKKTYSIYECGGNFPNKENFVLFQKKSTPFFEQIVPKDAQFLDGEKSTLEILKSVLTSINK